jgi:putative component of toxin-antitoxin plasmid stabilization module
VLLLCEGDKSTQANDIEQAKRYWSEYGRRP